MVRSTEETKGELSTKTNVAILAGMFIVSIIFWNTIVLYPLKLFVVGLHELSHGLTAVLVGGKIDHIQIDRRIGGYCVYALPVNSGFFQRIDCGCRGLPGQYVLGGDYFYRGC